MIYKSQDMVKGVGKVASGLRDGLFMIWYMIIWPSQGLYNRVAEDE